MPLTREIALGRGEHSEETLVPLDVMESGMISDDELNYTIPPSPSPMESGIISDDELNYTMIRPLPEGAKISGMG